jgi:hypothetical protein
MPKKNKKKAETTPEATKFAKAKDFFKVRAEDQWGHELYTVGKGKNAVKVDKILARLVAARNTIRVYFPDGSSSDEAIVARSKQTNINDMGHSYNVTTTLYFVSVNVRGAWAEIPITDLKVFFPLKKKGDA